MVKAAGGFKPHTISGHIGEVTLNEVRVGEIALELAAFMGTKLLAVVGEEAAITEAKALCSNTVGIPVKGLERDWFPTASETRSAIYEGTLEALRKRDEATGLHLEPPFRFTYKPADGYALDPSKKFLLHSLVKRILFGRCNGQMSENEASWETRTIIGGLYAIATYRTFTVKR